MIDLHTHSNFSDGDLSPASLMYEAVKHGLKAIALTDHDTINGLDDAKKAALSAGIRFIPGIELNIDWNSEKLPKGISGLGKGGEFHLLGLGINSPSEGFITAIRELSRRRKARNYEILDKLHELSIIDEKPTAVWDELTAMSYVKDANGKPIHGKSLGRLHFARFLIKRKIVKNVKQAFARYLSEGKPLYAPKAGLPFDEAASLIRESGGIPVLAHPVSLYVAWGRLSDLVKTLKDMGLMGIEAWHPTAKPGFCRRLEALAKSLELCITEGSDFHSYSHSEMTLGHSNRGRKINYTVLDSIKALAST